MLRQVNPSNHTPISLEEVKAHLRLDHQTEDDYLNELIKSSINVVETYLGRSLLKQTWCLTQVVDQPGQVIIKLPNPPLLSILEVKAIYSDVKQKLLKRFALKGNHMIPQLEVMVDAKGVEVTYEAGYGDQPKHVPSAIKQAILMAVADLYAHREMGEMHSDNLWQTLLQPFKVWRVL